MEPRDLLLACLAAAGGEPFQPVHIQKMLFIAQEVVGDATGKPFVFVPYNYGPFCTDVYSTLDALAVDEMVEIIGQPCTPGRIYRSSKKGLEEGQTILGKMDPEASQYLVDLAKWVRSQSFRELVSAVYKEYPAMAERSIFFR